MKFNTEKESIDWFVNRLQSKGWTKISSTQAYDKFSYYDVEAEYNGKRVRFELKRRNFNSDKFGDCMCEYSKYRKFLLGIELGEFSKGYLVSLFEDKMVLSDITRPRSIMFKDCPSTTEFENNNYIEKKTVHYGQEIIKDYEE